MPRARHAHPTSVSRRLRLPLAAVLVAALAAFAAVVVPLTAQAVPVALSGVVVGPTNKAVPSVMLTAIPLTGGTSATAKTSTSGSFAFPSLLPGDYTLQFAATATTFPQYLGSTSQLADAQVLTLESGAGNKTYIKAALGASGTLTGTVKTSAKKALAGYSVRAYFQSPDASWTLAKTVKTTSKGAYSLTGLEPGSYRLEALSTAATPPYAPLYSGGAHDLTQATDIVVLAGKSVATNFVLGAAGKVSGVVTGAVGPQNLAGVVVTPFHLIGPASGYTGFEELTSLAKTSSASGAYTLSGLAPGVYTLKFSPKIPSLTSTTYESTFLGNNSDVTGGTYFTVAAGGVVTGKNIQLGQAAHIFGEVVDAALWPGTPTVVPHLRIILESAGADPFDGLHTPRSVVSDALGAFDFVGVAPGPYEMYVGSITDTDPSDGVAEDTTWERVKESSFVVSAGGDFFQRFLADKKVGGLHVDPANKPFIAPGSYQVGAELAINPGGWLGATGPVTSTYQWLRNGGKIPGETAQQHTVSPADQDALLSVRVTAHNFAYGTATYTTVATPNIVAGDAPTATVGPSINGSIAVGTTVTVTTGQWTAFGIDPSMAADPGILWNYHWQISPDGVNGWIQVPDGGTPEYTINANDLVNGPFFRVHLAGQRQGYANAIYDSPPQAIVDGVATFLTQPKVTKTATTLKLTAGTMTPAVANANTFYRWLVYEADGTTSTEFDQQTLSLIGKAGKYIVGSTRTNVSHINSAFADVVGQKGAAPTGSPESLITGTVAVESTVSAPAVTWSNPAPNTVSYSWQYLNGTKWVTIPGANASSYYIAPAYLNRHLRSVQTTDRDGYLSASRTSAQTGLVAVGAAPAPFADPTLATGAPAANTLLSLDAGAWAPAPTGFTYKWKTSATAGLAGPFTALATSTTPFYTVPGNVDGKYLVVDVVAARAGHTSGVFSLAIGQVTAGIVVNTVLPKVTHVGGVYTASNGTWSPAAGFYTFDWRWFAADGTTTTTFSGIETADTSALVNDPIEVLVTGDKSGFSGTTVTVMAKLGTLVPSSPATVTLDPTTPGLVDTEFLAHAAPGYGPNTVTTTYQWQYLKTAPNGWANIAAQNGQSFYPTGSALVGKQVRVAVTVTNPLYTTLVHYSSASLVSLAAGTVPSPVPPSFDATPGIGNKLTVDPGVWSDSGTSYSYQWKKEVTPGTFANIVGATTTSYVIPITSLGQQIQVVVTHHWTGHANGTFTLTGTIGNGQLANIVPPVVTKSGTTLKAGNGTWNATGPTFSYEWLRYDPADDSSTVIGTAGTYALTGSDTGAYLTVRVRAAKTNYTYGDAIVTAQLGNKVGPVTGQSVLGAHIVGLALTANTPDWNVVVPTVARQWLRNGVAIMGATAAAYTQQPIDLGKTISVRITASKPGYVTGVTTLATGVTLSATVPTVVTYPTVKVAAVNNFAVVGSPMVASPGTWSLPGLTFAYQWMRNAVPIAGATAATYLPVASDALSEIWVVVTASKALTYGPASERSESHYVAPGESPQITSPLPGGLLHVTGGTVGGTASKATGTLVAPAITWNMPVTMSYAWYADGAPIAGANSSTLVLSTAPQVLAGSQVWLQVDGLRPGYDTYSAKNSQQITIVP